MAVNATHPDYDDKEKSWERARAVIAGEDAVKAAGANFLPKLDSQNAEEYNSYKTRAQFFNATGRTLDGLIGMVFRKSPTVIVPDGNALENERADINLRGTSIDDYARDIVREVLSVGRVGTMIEWEDQVEERVFVIKYCAEHILNWKVQRFNGRMHLSLVVLKEYVTVDSPLAVRDKKTTSSEIDDEYEHDVTEQIRVLKLVPTAPVPGTQAVTLEYVVEIWQKNNDSGRDIYTLIETRQPTRAKKPLSAIPFIFHGPKNSFPDVDKLPLDDLICTNLDHYRLDADYKHGLHFTGLPTAWVAGFPEKTVLRIGSTTAWVTENIGAKAGFLEFTGQGLSAIVEALDRDEKLMAVLGARLLESQKRDAETAETLRIRQSGETSVLGNVGTSISQSMTTVLKWLLWWTSTEETPDKITNDMASLTLNTDFISMRMSGDEITALVKTWQSAGISHQTLLHNLRQGEILPAGRTDEDEMALIEQNLPPLLNPTTVLPAPAPTPVPKPKPKPKK